MSKKQPFRWLNRRVACLGPYLTLVLSQEEMDAALKAIGLASVPYIGNAHSQATAHCLTSAKGDLCSIVAMRGYEGRDPIEVAGLLVHEAVHVWQDYIEHIGEHTPGREQEAYAIQGISQELMAEFARRMEAPKP